MNRHVRLSLVATLALVCTVTAAAQQSAGPSFAVAAAAQYQVAPNVTYLTASNYESKMDIYWRRGTPAPVPTVIYIHGGFWAAGNKEGAYMILLPWMEMGWNVVNVEYRLARVAPAPAAVEDILCALRFVAAQAKNYNVDANRIVVTGESAGGHLALAAAMIPESTGLAQICAGTTAIPRVAAAINWFGITDVWDVIQGPNKANAAITWFGSLTNREEIARRVSPLTYVRADLPPIMTVHGDKDPVVPYQHAVRLHEALGQVKVPNQLYTVAGGSHGGFSADERAKIYTTIKEFLTKNKIM